MKRLKEIQSNELFESFNKHYKNDVTNELHRILSQIDFLIEQKSVVEKYHISILTQNNELRNEIQDLLEKYLDLVSDSIRDIKNEDKAYNDNPLWIFINQKMIDYYNKQDRNNTISYLYFHLLRPIQVELVQKEYDRTNLHAEKITRLGKTISTRRFYLKHQTISIKLQYRQFYNELISLKKDFLSSTEKIQNIK